MSPAQTPGENDAFPRLGFIAIAVLFALLVFSAELVEAITNQPRVRWPWWLLPTVDAGLLAIALLLTSVTYWRRADFAVGKFLILWLIGALATLALDLPATFQWGHQAIGIDLILSICYVAALAVILAATVGYFPQGLLPKKHRKTTKAAWIRFRTSIPLLLGTLAAYFSSTLWRVIDDGTNRSISHIKLTERDFKELGGTSRIEIENYLNSLCGNAIDQEYFAQVSQVLPLLLVALGLEARFFSKLTREPVGKALTLNAVFFLMIGEALALSTLPASGDGCVNMLLGWHEYLAFVITFEACVIALITLFWALMWHRDEPDGPQEDGVPISKVRSQDNKPEPKPVETRQSPSREREAVAFSAGIVLSSLVAVALSKRRSRD
ncbi:hypothetical protein ACFWNN_19235 [Lentzea sp. NPDC058450]|uniref:hypothetical protein n=1 Tax=Lentzea sp. NPDC058450 TaxID=3346505 RepID=UPI003652B34D